MVEIVYKPIGIIHSPFKKTDGMPIQPNGASGIRGSIELFPEYKPGLKDIDGFSHIILIYHFHLAKGSILQVKPFLENKLHGIFAVRAPTRPNPIGFSIVRLVQIDDNILQIEDVDIVDGTPLLDIKPYVPDFDWREADKTGWLTRKSSNAKNHKSDKRFNKD